MFWNYVKTLKVNTSLLEYNSDLLHVMYNYIAVLLYSVKT